jgi:hypothetical protein
MKKLTALLLATVVFLALSAPALRAGTEMAAAPAQDQFAPPPNGYWVPAQPPVAYYPPPYVVVAPPPYYYAYGPRYYYGPGYYGGPRYYGGVGIALPGFYFSFGGHRH